MLDEITFGNAASDSENFGQWFVGNIQKWCENSNNPPFIPEQFGLRQNEAVEIKWAKHEKGEERHSWAKCADRIAICVLIRGDMIFKFHDPKEDNKTVQQRLSKEGDYLIWKEDVEHSWVAMEESLIIIVRWINTNYRIYTKS